MSPKLSVIIPCFNCEKTILHLLNILKDNTSRLIEIILINDGSTDNTRNIIRDFIENYKNQEFNIAVYDIINCGAAKARQFGLSKSTGEYIFFCDSDDIVIDNYSNLILNNIDSSEFDILFFNSMFVKHSSEICKLKYKIKFDYDVYFNKPEDFLYFQLKNDMWTAAVWSFIFRRDVYASSQAYFTLRKAHEDHMFTMMILFDCKKIKCINELLYIQNITEGSLTNSSKDWQYIEDRYNAYIEIREKYSNKMSQKTLSEYEVWSIGSYLELLIRPKLNIVKCLSHFNFYYIFFTNIFIVFKFVFKKFLGKFYV